MIALRRHVSIDSAILVGHSMGGHIAGCPADAQECRRRDMQSDPRHAHFVHGWVETVKGYHMMFSSPAMAASMAHLGNKVVLCRYFAGWS